MEKLIEWIKSLPKGVQFGLIICVFVGMCYGVIRVVFADKFVKEPENIQENILLDMPDPSEKKMNDSELHKYQQRQYDESPESYWDDLEEKDGDSGLALSGSSGGGSRSNPEEISIPKYDKSKYTSFENLLIQSGSKTVEEVEADRLAEQRRREEERRREEAAAQPAYTQEQIDSMTDARMERAYKLAMKYAQPQQPEQKEEKKEEEETPQPRRLNFDGSNALHIPEESYSSDDICSSLDASFNNGITYSKGDVTVRPARATFVKTERIVAGQRIIMRLMEDLQLSNGNIIPANTHISGICAMGSRLEIKVTTLQFGGKIFNTDLSVYDNDGTEGIYCPVIEKKQSKKSAERIGTQTASGLASAAGSALGGAVGSLAGTLASTAINELSQITLKDGSIAIDVVSGYEFYIFENIEELAKQKKDN